MTKRIFQFELLTTDAKNLKGDLIFLGNKTSIKKELEKSQNDKFKAINKDFQYGKAELEILELKNHIWKQVVAVNYASRIVLRESLYLKLFNIFNYSFSLFHPERTIMIPFSWRFSENVTKCTLFAFFYMQNNFQMLGSRKIDPL